ncbi:MAG: metal-sulfur cluster assembly factor [Mariniphaga sp.]|jgi:metal-sulfur cluster biosynthetic enzyme
MSPKEKDMIELLREVIDPELMVNIVDLGLVYDVKYDESEEKVDVMLTLTSPGCPMGGIIIEDAENSIKTEYPECEVSINLVWEPPWSTEMLTERGREELGFY